MINYVPDAPGSPYRAGACNIGPAELARRRQAAWILTAMAVGVAVLLVVSGVPDLVRVVELPFAAGTAVGWLQVIRRFCAGFGMAGLANFGVLGGHGAVRDETARAADRRTALKLTLEGALYGLVATIALVLLPI